MYNLRILTGVLATAAASALFAAAPVPHLDEIRFYQSLIEDMGGRDSAGREKAERRLGAIGSPAIPYLRQAARHPDPEVRRRVLRLLPVLEHAKLVAPKRYSLRVTDQPLEGVLKALSKTTGYRIDNNRPWAAAGPGVKAADGKFTYDFKDATFWEIADRVCKDAGLTVQPSYGDDTLRLYSSGAVPMLTGVAGSFRYASGNFQLYRNVELTAPPGGMPPARTETLTFNFTINAEPRLPFLGNTDPRLEAAYDDLKGSMLPPPEAEEAPMFNPWGGRVTTRRYGGSGQKQFVLNVSTPLGKASAGAKTLKVLRGTVPVTLLVEQKQLEVSGDILKADGKKADLAGVEFLVHEVKTMPNSQYQVRMTVTNKGSPSDYAWMNTLHQRIVLHDEAGVKFQNYGSSWGGGPGAVSVQLTMTFGVFNAKIGKPKKLTYEHWVTAPHDVPFEFRDVPLP